MNNLEWPWVAISCENPFSISTSWIRAFECQKITQPLRNLCDSAVFCALHDQLAGLGRHAQLTRCFSAVAELLVNSIHHFQGYVTFSTNCVCVLLFYSFYAVYRPTPGTINKLSLDYSLQLNAWAGRKLLYNDGNCCRAGNQTEASKVADQRANRPLLDQWQSAVMWLVHSMIPGNLFLSSFPCNWSRSRSICRPGQLL